MNYLIELYKRFKSQIVNLSIYLLASLIPMLLALMANPSIAMNMSPEDYAIVGYYAAFNTLLAPLINFFLLHYYTKRFFELNDEERLILKATIFKALILFSLLLAVGSIVVLYFYIAIFNADSKIPFLPYAVMSVMVLPITGIYS
ncbi:MAG: hypothetical protein GX921_08205, partial [Bacteroidales bacterium]|nr:hypothetical protein [Bacteroidales bacterium]